MCACCVLSSLEAWSPEQVLTGYGRGRVLRAITSSTGGRNDRLLCRDKFHHNTQAIMYDSIVVKSSGSGMD